jgi:hypothetical protein
VAAMMKGRSSQLKSQAVMSSFSHHRPHQRVNSRTGKEGWLFLHDRGKNVVVLCWLVST